jgi:myosin light chain 6
LFLRHSDVRDVFDLFDFWDGRDGMVDGAKIGDVMRCIGLNPTNKMILDNGGTKKLGKLKHDIV